MAKQTAAAENAVEVKHCALFESGGKLAGVEGDEKFGNGGPDIKIGSPVDYLPKQRSAVRPQFFWEGPLIAPLNCESVKPIYQVLTQIRKLDTEGRFGADESVKEGPEIFLDIYPY